MRFFRTASALVIAFVLAGCSQAATWQKPGASPADFQRDASDCTKEEDARESAYGGSRLTNSPHIQGYEDQCLAARGWTRGRAPSS